MDVRCERCNTDYEFDDALVSGRGTTVKCTNCGHKFKIRRSDGDFSEDFWNVQTHDGRTLVFTSLRELQRAIQTNLVERHDLLSRGGLKQKPIGQIPELAPFFDVRDQRKSQAPPPVVAINAISPTSTTSPSRPPPPPGAASAAALSAPPLPPPRKRLSTRPDYPPPPPDRQDQSPVAAAIPSMKKTLHGTGSDGIDVPTSAQSPSSPPARVSIAPPLPPAALRQNAERASAAPGPTTPKSTPPTTERLPERESQSPSRGLPPVVDNSFTRTQPIPPVVAASAAPKVTPAPPAPIEMSSPLPPPSVPALRAANMDDEYSDGVRSRPSSLSESLSPSLQRRRSVGGFIVAAVVLAGVALIGAVWAKDHLGGAFGSKPQAVVETDPRVVGLLAAGEKALADGNLDTAKESFDKASALAEKNPRVLVDAARLATIRADVPWLRARLLSVSPDATDDIRLTKDTLGELSSAARKAADDALAVAPDDPAAIRTKVDALRIAGDREAARALVSKVGSSSSQPETAYVLAALDLADPEPLWATVIERLRVAASAESGPGRARAALAYALARSGEVASAKAEVERLSAMSRQHALLPQLRAFTEHAKPAAKVDVVPDAGPMAMGVDAGRPGPRVGGGAEPALPSDARKLVAQADAARAKGDHDRALMLYQAAVDRNGGDTEALNGLASVAHARRDLPGARAGYKRVLSINPSYVPALVGAGDVDWEAGDRATAMKTYKEIVDRFPEGSYPPRVKQRLESAAPAPPPPPASTPAPAPAEPGGGG